MYLSRRGCLLREDGLSKLGLGSTTRCRRITIFPTALSCLRDTCPKMSWKPMNLETMGVMKVFPSWPPCEAFEQNWWSLVITETWYCKFKFNKKGADWKRHHFLLPSSPAGLLRALVRMVWEKQFRIYTKLLISRCYVWEFYTVSWFFSAKFCFKGKNRFTPSKRGVWVCVFLLEVLEI